MKNISIIAIDLAKNSFHVRGVTHTGRAVVDKRVSRESFFETVIRLPKEATIAMEACGSSHYWAREFGKQGFQVRLIPAQFVKPYVKSQKNDRADAEAIAEAASRANMRTVAVKTEEQQVIQALHRIRQRLVRARTSLMNEMRGLVAEFGFAIPVGDKALRCWLVELGEHALPTPLREALHDMAQELETLTKRIASYEMRLKYVAKTNPVCKRLMTIPGVGIHAATGLYAAVGDARQFKNGRAMAASFGLVPRQFSTGGKVSLGRITKRGDKYIRCLLVHGSRAALRTAAKRTDPYSLWAMKVRQLRGYNRAAVALANRTARIAWALMVNPEAQFSAHHSSKPLLH